MSPWFNSRYGLYVQIVLSWFSDFLLPSKLGRVRLNQDTPSLRETGSCCVKSGCYNLSADRQSRPHGGTPKWCDMILVIHQWQRKYSAFRKSANKNSIITYSTLLWTNETMSAALPVPLQITAGTPMLVESFRWLIASLPPSSTTSTSGIFSVIKFKCLWEELAVANCLSTILLAMANMSTPGKGYSHVKGYGDVPLYRLLIVANFAPKLSFSG